jgi:hypothetical protein
MEAKVFVETFGCFTFSLINVGKFPLLVLASVLVVDNDASVLFVFVSRDIEDLVVLNINDEFVVISEQLPPS